jgi:hypothetical protein
MLFLPVQVGSAADIFDTVTDFFPIGAASMKKNNPPFDLFGQIAVTLDDVTLWVENVARIDRHSPRAAMYVKHYAIVEKIRAAKIAGTFDTITPANDDLYDENQIEKHCPREFQPPIVRRSRSRPRLRRV